MKNSRAPKKKALAAGIQAAVTPAEAPPAPPAPPHVDAFNLIAQYVMDKVQREDPATRAVMDRALGSALNTVRAALGG